jgi:hypothetical protein
MAVNPSVDFGACLIHSRVNTLALSYKPSELFVV